MTDAEFLPVAAPTKEERTWAMLCHLSIVAQLFLPILVLAPLVILLVKGDQMPFVKLQSKEVINLQITLLLAAIVSCVLLLVGIGVILLCALWLYSVVVGVIAAVRVNDGINYRYPFNWRLIN